MRKGFVEAINARHESLCEYPLPPESVAGSAYRTICFQCTDQFRDLDNYDGWPVRCQTGLGIASLMRGYSRRHNPVLFQIDNSVYDQVC